MLACYYLFRIVDAATAGGTVVRVWRAEGIYDDFARSGMSDLPAFVLQDFWGAGFFHLLAGLVLAAVFGSATAALVSRLPAETTATRIAGTPHREMAQVEEIE
ncbi:hypothetical protein ACIA5D_39380 [Actinoplanes sp. NPDC051513]|uniref:hypothetical protein n=1 Tax=Actinoplanes sp. NPDC051513 TaxID=3363908 RepID=UPI00379BB910